MTLSGLHLQVRPNMKVTKKQNKKALQIVSFFFSFFRGHSKFSWFTLLLLRRRETIYYFRHTYLPFLELVSFWKEIFSVIPFAPCIHTKRTKTNQLIMIQFVPMLFVPINKLLWLIKNWSHKESCSLWFLFQSTQRNGGAITPSKPKGYVSCLNVDSQYKFGRGRLISAYFLVTYGPFISFKKIIELFITKHGVYLNFWLP